ncbi:P-loop containing nucleoside triphosphate hydrolase protein [Lipomyces doorenjongii]|uniref:P-loop containing nucleoside triphosphate hydrolase protein n=1 Tax=Lipomyces doorenjongii TaxID=383834 RepID=UPI0034CDF604
MSSIRTDHFHVLFEHSTAKVMHIYILGASGSGKTTLGNAISAYLNVKHEDADDIYWEPTEKKFTQRRSSITREEVLRERLNESESWVFSGVALPWAASIEPLYDLVIFLQVDPKVRMERLRVREVERYGDRILDGGDRYEHSAGFLRWAKSYDLSEVPAPDKVERPTNVTLAAHETWLSGRLCPVLRLDSARPVDEMLLSTINFMREKLSLVDS